MHFIVEEIDEDTSMEELQKMMLVALVYRILVCFYEVSAHIKVFCTLYHPDSNTSNVGQNCGLNLSC